MKKTLELQTKVPVLSWAKEVDGKTLAQVVNLANLPFAYHHVALMADAHAGYGMPIGGVLALENAIIPNAVGVDIGCGVRIIKTNLGAEDLGKDNLLHEILVQISRDIPVGFRHHEEKQEAELFSKTPNIEILQKEKEAAKTQVGTLGGGNHFIEIQSDEEGNVWVMVHSGSRNYGKKTADYYYKKAIEYDGKNKFETTHRELSWFPFDSKEGQEYFRAMNFCLEFAKENRKQMAEKIIAAFLKFIPQFRVTFEHDIHHNYAAVEDHFGKKLIVHRKGATKAEAGQMCLIPGSMGTKSFLAEGLGNADSFKTCSHGAGRAMGRKEAKRRFGVAEVLEELRSKNIEIFTPSKRDLPEEASKAYKNIEEIMASQADLVKPIHTLSPLGVVKG